MPITPTYPGVYIEEIPSEVRTITGVATSIAAFLGYFSRGPMNRAVQIFNPGDFEREFGGLRADSEAAYAIQQFFLNGGARAWVVRVAAPVAEATASVTLQDDSGTDVLTLEAANPGVLGNDLRVEVDYDTTNQATQFNLTVSTEDNSTQETFSDLTIATADATINAGSALVTASLVGAPATRPAQTGTTGGQLTDPPPAQPDNPFEVLLNGQVLGSAATWGSNLVTLSGVAGRLQTRLQAVAGLAGATVDVFDDRLRILPNTGNDSDVVTLQDTTGNIVATLLLNAANDVPNEQRFPLVGGVDGEPNAAAIDVQDAAGGTAVLRLTAANEGAWGNNLRADIDYNTTDPAASFNLTVTELGTVSGQQQVVATEVFRNLVLDATSARHAVDVVNDGSKLVVAALVGAPAVTDRPAQTGTTSGALNLGALPANGTIAVSLNGNAAGSFTVDPVPTTTASALAAALQSALRAASAQLSQATVEVVGSASTQQMLRIKAGTDDPADLLTFADSVGTLAQTLGINDAGRSNVQQYELGASSAAGAQALPNGLREVGYDGGLPGATDLIGSELLRTGMYALLEVDLFNLLCIPDTMRLADPAAGQVAAAAIALCEAERAFYILDVPQSDSTRDEVDEIQQWLDENASLRHRNDALYFPRPQIADPRNEFRLRLIASSGTMAGLYARTDGSRGVWKAPAGTEAGLRGVQKLEYKLTDAQNGVLNPLAINCLRNFPVFGNVSWGARTLDGADQRASEWKYIPVRRTALFIEESLFRGTQWVVFEPNDEPLWAQIRLNVGAFMHNLFRQGAFQGTTPREAYFVKCDKETTTQNDIDNGIVNIVVGFAPLKPAEFVIIKLQQIAGQIET